MDAQITLTPTSDEDGPALRALHTAPDVAQWWDFPEPGFPMHDEPESTRFTIRCGGEIAGLVQYGEENEPKYRSASIDIFLGPAFHGRGIGTRAVRMVLDILIRERVTIASRSTPRRTTTRRSGATRRPGSRASGSCG